MIDGGLLQMFYFYEKELLKKHRLAFFPSPDLLEYQNNPEIYELDELYSEVIMKNVVTSPMRFDFDENKFEAILHPMSHLTIGQYKNCRIPLNAPLTPFRFARFIVGSFYNAQNDPSLLASCALCPAFEDTIHPTELLLAHFRA